MRMLPENVMEKRNTIGSPDEIFMFEFCPNCKRVLIKRFEIKIDRSNYEYIEKEIVQKQFVHKIMKGFLEPYRNYQKCNCISDPPIKTLVQAVLCCERQEGEIDNHYYIDFIEGSIEEKQYKRAFEINWESLLGSIQYPEEKKQVKKTISSHYIFIDTETTGLPLNYNAPITDTQNWPRLVQISWIEFDLNGSEISTNDFIIKPDGFNIPIASTLINNISHAQALNKGHDLSSVLSKLSSRAQNSQIIVGHNIEFDLSIIGAEFYRMNMNNQLVHVPKLCTMKLTKEFCGISNKYGYKFPSLQELHFKLFNSSVSGSHNALNDIKATAKCFWELKRLNKI